MVADMDVAWLAGIIDGEGCITAKRCSERALNFRVTVETVSETMIARVRDILHQLGVEYRLEGPLWREKSTRPSIRVKVDKKHSVLRLCDLILPYSVVKKPELVLIKIYLDKAAGRIYYSATEEDLQILSTLRELKKVA
jgi:hypothetical protein